jgi:hypothetical protein
VILVWTQVSDLDGFLTALVVGSAFIHADTSLPQISPRRRKPPRKLRRDFETCGDAAGYRSFAAPKTKPSSTHQILCAEVLVERRRGPIEESHHIDGNGP